jgi:hypothetical protein
MTYIERSYYQTLQDEFVALQQCNLTISHVGSNKWKLSIKVQHVSNVMNRNYYEEHNNNNNNN